MNNPPGRYSKYLRLINISLHLFIINVTIYYFNTTIASNPIQLLYVNFSWFIIAYLTNFYETFRFIDLTKLIARLITQYIVFLLVYFSFYAITQQSFDEYMQFKMAIILFFALLLTRLFFYFALRIYRMRGRNFRRVIIVGNGAKDKTLQDFFLNRSEFGYKFEGFFSDVISKSDYYKGALVEVFNFVLNNNIDEIYCSLEVLTKEQRREFIKFSEDNYKVLKFIPKANDLFRKEVNLEYYDYIPVLALRKNPLSKPLENFLKRIFDILFSIFVIVFVLSWLSIILWLCMRLESKGTLFFKQEREGLNGKQFYCYKFRSMHRNELENIIQTKKNDQRITIVGKFIRKTSIDELPQFINVFLGNMSVVGPRPHMLTQGEKFKEVVEKYNVRHFVKPGITGLAQVKGFRGEISTKSDIQNRVKFDLFYIENWTFLLDIKIIVLTVLNAIKGEEKAY